MCSWEQTNIAVVNRVVRSMRCSDQVFRIEDVLVPVSQVLNGHRVHVMDDHPPIDLESLDPEVAAQISCDHEATKCHPLPRLVELLVDPTVETEG